MIYFILFVFCTGSLFVLSKEDRYLVLSELERDICFHRISHIGIFSISHIIGKDPFLTVQNTRLIRQQEVIMNFAGSVIKFGPIWSYNDESSWPGGFCKFGGKRQSPIDIQSKNVIIDFEKQFIKYGKLKYKGYEAVLLTGINNGHTVQFSTEGDNSMHPTLTGGPLKHNYRLEQLHFHWLSEHAVNGAKYPMEIHFVHVRSDLKVSEALNKRDGLAIVSVFCNVKTELKPEEADISEELMHHIPLLMKTANRISGVLMDLEKLIPVKDSYYSYLGSLTSPECNEVVVWIIYDKPIHISDALYRVFGNVGVGRHNYRSLQRLSHHIVFQPPPALIATPLAVQMFSDAVKVIRNFFRNITSFVSRGLHSR